MLATLIPALPLDGQAATIAVTGISFLSFYLFSEVVISLIFQKGCYLMHGVMQLPKR